mgnify:CR=1 FL=1
MRANHSRIVVEKAGGIHITVPMPMLSTVQSLLNAESYDYIIDPKKSINDEANSGQPLAQIVDFVDPNLDCSKLQQILDGLT